LCRPASFFGICSASSAAEAERACLPREREREPGQALRESVLT